MTKEQTASVLVGPRGPIAHRVRWATTLRARRRGVRGRPLGPDEAMILRPCRQVHTVGVRHSLDAVFCDEELRVLDVQTLSPRRISRRVAGAIICVELPGGSAQAAGIVPGVCLSLEEPA